MNNIDLIISVYVLVDDALKQIKFKSKPGPISNLTNSELFTIMLVRAINDFLYCIKTIRKTLLSL